MNPPGVDAIEAAVRQLLAAGLLQEVRGVSAAFPWRRSSLPPAGAEENWHAERVRRPSGGPDPRRQRAALAGPGERIADREPHRVLDHIRRGDDDPVQLNITQSGNTITGTLPAAEAVSGTVTGTLSGTTLDVTSTSRSGAVCSVTGTFTSTECHEQRVLRLSRHGLPDVGMHVPRPQWPPRRGHGLVHEGMRARSGLVRGRHRAGTRIRANRRTRATGRASTQTRR